MTYKEFYDRVEREGVPWIITEHEAEEMYNSTDSMTEVEKALVRALLAYRILFRKYLLEKFITPN